MNRKQRTRLASRSLALLAFLVALASAASAEWKEKVLYSFQGGSSDGSTPAGGVVFDSLGNLYGATSGGGSGSCAGFFQCGMVYQLSPPAQKGGPWTETVLHNFQGNKSGDGTSPGGGLVIDKAGNLYGTTGYGGTGGCVLLGSKEGCGTVYELSPPKVKGGAWTEKVLYSFKGGKDGYVPDGDLVFDSAGNLYGATLFGGGKGTSCNSLYQYCGTVFELSPPQQKGGKWTEKPLHSFAGGTAGANPNGGLVFDSKGAIYGTTPIGGNQKGKCSPNGCGTVFFLHPTANAGGALTEQLIHRFDGSDGASPEAGVVFGTDGNLYGTTFTGPGPNGLVFELQKPYGETHSWTETVLHTFSGGNDGANPAVALFLDNHGDLYGTASVDGGGAEYGTVFRLKQAMSEGEAWTFNLVYAFPGVPNGRIPKATLISDGNGSLYGTTTEGGTGTCGYFGCGTVFEVSP